MPACPNLLYYNHLSFSIEVNISHLDLPQGNIIDVSTPLANKKYVFIVSFMNYAFEHSNTTRWQLIQFEIIFNLFFILYYFIFHLPNTLLTLIEDTKYVIVGRWNEQWRYVGFNNHTLGYFYPISYHIVLTYRMCNEWIWLINA